MGLHFLINFTIRKVYRSVHY